MIIANITDEESTDYIERISTLTHAKKRFVALEMIKLVAQGRWKGDEFFIAYLQDDAVRRAEAQRKDQREAFAFDKQTYVARECRIFIILNAFMGENSIEANKLSLYHHILSIPEMPHVGLSNLSVVLRLMVSHKLIIENEYKVEKLRPGTNKKTSRFHKNWTLTPKFFELVNQMYSSGYAEMFNELPVQIRTGSYSTEERSAELHSE